MTRATRDVVIGLVHRVGIFAPGRETIRTGGVDYSTSSGFNVAALGVAAILAAPYAIFGRGPSR